jgi:O-antigen/teichoic acid export membrane protein
MTLLRKLAGETAIYGFSYILSRILHYFLFTIYLTRVFNDDTSQFGIYRDLYFYVAIVLVVLTFRMETTYFRYAKEDRSKVTTMSMSFLMLLASVFLVGLWFFRHDLATWMHYEGMTTHLMLLGGVLFFDILCSVPFASLRQQNRPWVFLALKLGSILFNIIFVVFFIELLPGLSEGGGFWEQIYRPGDQLFYVFLSNMLASMVTFIGLLPFMRGQSLEWDFSFFKRMLRYSWPLVIVGFAGVINQSSYITFQKYILPNDVATNLSDGGVFAAAASLALLLNLFTIAFNYAAEPFFFAHKERQDARQVYADVALAFTLVGSTMMLFILAYIDLFQFILGSNFRAGLYVVPILLLAYLLLGIYYNFSAWYKLADKTVMGAWIAIAGAVITVVGNVLLIQRMEVIGSAWSALACYLFMCIASYYIGQKYFPIPYRIGRMIGWIAGAVITYFLMEALRSLVAPSLVLILLVNTSLVGLYFYAVLKFESALVKQIRKPNKV